MSDTTEPYPIADEVVLRRIGQMEGAADPTPLTEADYDRLRDLLTGQIVSTGDPCEIFEIIEIAPPDEPARVTEETVVVFT